MEESKLKALVNLLDDNDPEVYEQVHNELLKFGKNHYDSLKNFYLKNDNEVTKLRLRIILQELQSEFLKENLLKWRKSGGENLLDGWLMVSQFFHPTLNTIDYKKKISSWVHQIWLKTQPSMKIPQKLKTVLNFLKSIGFIFSPSEDSYQNPDFMYIHQVIDNKNGNTLSLSMLLNIIFHQLEIFTHVVSFKEYYAVRYLDHYHHYYIDVFNTDEIFHENDVKLFLLKLNLDSNLLHYKPISNIYLILFLLNYAKDLYKLNENNELYTKTQELLDYIDIRLI